MVFHSQSSYLARAAASSWLKEDFARTSVGKQAEKMKHSLYNRLYKVQRSYQEWKQTKTLQSKTLINIARSNKYFGNIVEDSLYDNERKYRRTNLVVQWISYNSEETKNFSLFFDRWPKQFFVRRRHTYSHLSANKIIAKFVSLENILIFFIREKWSASCSDVKVLG